MEEAKNATGQLQYTVLRTCKVVAGKSMSGLGSPAVSGMVAGWVRRPRGSTTDTLGLPRRRTPLTF